MDNRYEKIIKILKDAVELVEDLYSNNEPEVDDIDVAISQMTIIGLKAVKRIIEYNKD